MPQNVIVLVLEIILRSSPHVLSMIKMGHKSYTSERILTYYGCNRGAGRIYLVVGHRVRVDASTYSPLYRSL